MPKRTVPQGAGKRVALLARTTRELRQRIEKATAESGRSLGQEVEYRLERSFNPTDFATQLFGSPAAIHLLVCMGSAIRAAQAYAVNRGFSETQTRDMIRTAINTIADVNLHTGGEINQPQVSFLENAPQMSPTDAGEKLAWDMALTYEQPLLDEFNVPLVERWSRLGGPPPTPKDIEWPEQETSLDTPDARKARRRAASKDRAKGSSRPR